MAWNTPATYSTGQVLTAANLNTYLRDNTQALKDQVDALTTVTAPGIIIAYGVNSAPGGWLLCDGSAVSRTTYATLFSIISTTWGAGNGSTTFNVPDLRGKTLFGFKSADANFGTFAASGGNPTHTIATANLPVHTHDLANHVHNVSASDPGHNHAHSAHSHSEPAHTHAASDTGYLSIVASIPSSTVFTNIGSNIDHTVTPQGSGGSAGTGWNIGTAVNTGGAAPNTNSSAGANSAATTGIANTGGPSNNISGATGSGTAIGILNPFATVSYIIKT